MKSATQIISILSHTILDARSALPTIHVFCVSFTIVGVSHFVCSEKAVSLMRHVRLAGPPPGQYHSPTSSCRKASPGNPKSGSYRTDCQRPIDWPHGPVIAGRRRIRAQRIMESAMELGVNAIEMVLRFKSTHFSSKNDLRGGSPPWFPFGREFMTISTWFMVANVVRRRILASVDALASGAVWVAILALASTSARAADRPNVVLIFADDVGYGDVGCYGATKVQTPNIDRLAKEGRMFTDAHSASAVCTPSRYALLTGEYPHRKNLYKPVFLRTGLIIDPQQQTLGSLMKDAGYATACIGKWHLGFGRQAPNWNGELKPGPLELGFDYYFGVPVVNSHPPFVYVENHHVLGLVPEDPFVFGQKAKTREFSEKMGLDAIGGADAAHALYDDEAVGTTFTEKAVDWIRSQKKNPFFLYLATTNIHHPFTPHPRFQGTSECGPYGDFIHELDWIVGEVMRTLEEQGVADNTLVIFTSDNGGMFNLGGQNAWEAGHQLNGELLGFKFSAWEGGHRVPFIVRWPGNVAGGSTSDQLISNIDMLATMAALTGRAVKEGHGQDSVNMLEAMTGNPSEPIRDHIILAASKPTHLASRRGKWMYIGARGGGGFTATKRGAHMFGGPAAITFTQRENSDIENGRIRPDAPPAQLYDLEQDLSQTTNVYSEHPAVVKELSELLRSYQPNAPQPKR